MSLMETKMNFFFLKSLFSAIAPSKSADEVSSHFAHFQTSTSNIMFVSCVKLPGQSQNCLPTGVQVPFNPNVVNSKSNGNLTPVTHVFYCMLNLKFGLSEQLGIVF